MIDFDLEAFVEQNEAQLERSERMRFLVGYLQDRGTRATPLCRGFVRELQALAEEDEA